MGRAIGTANTGYIRGRALGVQQAGNRGPGAEGKFGIVANPVDQVPLRVGLVAASRGKSIEVLRLDRIVEDLFFEPKG